jgi:hypothetical protein
VFGRLNLVWLDHRRHIQGECRRCYAVVPQG